MFGTSEESTKKMGNLSSKLRKPATQKVETPAAVAKTPASPTDKAAQISRMATKSVFLSASDISSKSPEAFQDTSKGRCEWTTLLSSGLTPSDQLTAGIARCPASVGFLAHHRHEQPELYFILKGDGLMKIDDVEQRVSKGGLVFVPSNAEHGIRNLNDQDDLVWLYCFPTDRFEDIVYKFSDGEKAVLEP